MNRIINYLFDVVRGVLFYFSQTKLRTALTLLGITVGVSSIIAIMTVLATFEKSTEQVVADVRTNVFYITRENPIEVSFGNNNKWTRNKPKITWSEYEQLKRSLKLIKNFTLIEQLFNNCHQIRMIVVDNNNFKKNKKLIIT